MGIELGSIYRDATNFTEPATKHVHTDVEQKVASIGSNLDSRNLILENLSLWDSGGVPLIIPQNEADRHAKILEGGMLSVFTSFALLTMQSKCISLKTDDGIYFILRSDRFIASFLWNAQQLRSAGCTEQILRSLLQYLEKIPQIDSYSTADLLIHVNKYCTQFL
jgi:predicted house-cleaning NTP pyrophosphatase (Maf/HAM1 superfamily)